MEFFLFSTGWSISTENLNVCSSSRASNMAKVSVAVQTQLQIPLVINTRPYHFTKIQINKLEDTFSRTIKPDSTNLRILAMECNLLYSDVVVSAATVF